MLLILCLSIGSVCFAQDEDKPQHYISIFFGGGSYYIDQQERAKLQDWLQTIPDIELFDVEIHGHTDDIGSLEYNQRLSRYRSRSVFQLLEQLQLDPASMQIMDFGEKNPVFDNATWEGKLMNRRVDVILKRPII